MMRNVINKIITPVIVLALIASATIAARAESDEQMLSQQQVEKKIRKELVTLPFYGVFDNLYFRIEGSTVFLYGQVVRPTTRSDAGRRAARVRGVERVVNNIEVLPLSPFDDSIRRRMYLTLFRGSVLHRYARGANPAIHIIVNWGHVTLEGTVANQMDKQLAYIAASSVSEVFSVTNNLRTESAQY